MEIVDAERRKVQEEQLRRHREEQTQLLQDEVASLQDELKDKVALVARIATLEGETARLRAELEAEKNAAQDVVMAADERAQMRAAAATANANAQAATAAAAAAAASVPRSVVDALRVEGDQLRERVNELEHQLIDKHTSSPKMAVVSKDALMFQAEDSDDEAAMVDDNDERERRRRKGPDRVPQTLFR